MKYVKQFLIIIGISLAGEILKYILPLPIPASIYGNFAPERQSDG